MLFVVADAPEKVDAALASLAGVLEVAPADAKDDVRLASVLNWLRTHPRWLLILDNVDDPGAGPPSRPGWPTWPTGTC